QQAAGSDSMVDNLAGGGRRTFDMGGGLDYKSGRHFEAETVAGVDPPALISADGAQNVYGLAEPNLDGSTNFFLTERIDRYGSILQKIYYLKNSGMVRISSLVDMDGRTNTIAYGNGTYPYLITAVTNAYGQVAQFNYNASGLLTNIVDAQL